MAVMKEMLLPMIGLDKRTKKGHVVQINDFFHEFAFHQNDDNAKQSHWRQFLFGRTSNN